MILEKEMTAPVASVGADAGQPDMYFKHSLILTNVGNGFNGFRKFRRFVTVLQFTAQQIQSLLTREKWASPKPREIKASRGVRGEMKIVAPQVTSFEI